MPYIDRVRAIAARASIALSLVGVFAVDAAVARADVTPPPTELPAVLTLDDALKVFRARGLDLLIAEANVRAAEGSVKIAGAIPNPGWSAGAVYTPTYNSNDPSCAQGATKCTGYGYSVALTDNAAIEDSLSGKRDLRLRVARSALAAAKMTRVDAQRNLEFQLKSAYAQLAQALLGYRFAKRTADSNVVTLEKFKVRLASGAINEGDYARILTQKLESEQALATAAQTLRQARVAVAFLMGVRGVVADFDVPDGFLDFHPRAVVSNATESSLLKLAVQHRPDLISAGYTKASAQSTIDLVKRQRFPDVAVSVGYAGGGWGGLGVNNPSFPPTVSFGLSGTIPIFYGLQGELRQAQAAYDVAALQYAKLVAQIASDVANAFAQERAAREMAERMEGASGLLAAARRAFETTAMQYDKGAASLTDYLDAYRTFVATQVEQYQDLANYWTAVFQLEQAVGMELR